MVAQLRYILVGFLLVVSSAIQAQDVLTLELVGWPKLHEADSFYVAGNFNGWHPKLDMLRVDGDKRVISLAMTGSNSFEFKITRGSWQKVEAAKDGSDIANRKITISNNSVLQISVEAWKDDIPIRPVSTASSNVSIMDSAFYIPQLNRSRRIWVYLPKDYKNTTRKYPVLYMHDGQNLFDANTSFSGEWGVDECFDTLKKQCIVVGIDNGSSRRLTEYTPYGFSEKGLGDFSKDSVEGKKYAAFLVKTLKPFIDKKYRTLADKNNTFIAGSSLGGLISFYAITKYPNVFGAAGIFSPAFWIVKKDLLKEINLSSTKYNSRIYYVAGDKESAEMLPDMNEIALADKKKHAVPATIISVPGGIHKESFWRQQMPAFINWLIK